MLTCAIMPSLLAADMGRLEEAARLAESAGADGLHIDIMDGHFVRNLSMGPDVVQMARRVVKLHLNVHLMVTRPDIFVEPFVRAGADTLSIHVEADSPIGPTLEAIRRAGARAGLVLNPETPEEAAWPYLELTDELLCMTVHPGFGGQKFIPEVLPKIEALRRRRPDLDIAVDGGLDEDSVALSAARGANVFLIGSTLYKTPDMAARVRGLRERIAAARLSSSSGSVSA